MYHKAVTLRHKSQGHAHPSPHSFDHAAASHSGPAGTLFFRISLRKTASRFCWKCSGGRYR
ncbi:hypothetical protein F9L00_18450 [Brucella anthropi]|nr:hypothetical protein F9K90_14485 [Brucella anthropi]KAB2752649.1 hypothetical protein F9K95_08885 [Brucella anthropi]KAB2775003.1 hypothetical protein F9L00_18450 [Brucella anthropi]RRY17320.1 hypothetical protein EGJ57_19020 [Brucella anthropi]